MIKAILISLLEAWRFRRFNGNLFFGEAFVLRLYYRRIQPKVSAQNASAIFPWMKQLQLNEYFDSKN